MANTAPFEWGGLIEKYLFLREESPDTSDPEMEEILQRLSKLGTTKDFGVFEEVFTSFSLKELSRLNSPILDAIYFDYYGVAIPNPTLPEEKLPNPLELLRKGKVPNSFKELLLREVKVLSLCQYFWARCITVSITEMQQIAYAICMNGTPEVFTFYLEQQVFTKVTEYNNGRMMPERWLCKLVEFQNLPLLAVIPDNLAVDRKEALFKAGRNGKIDNFQMMDALFEKYPELSEEKILYEFLQATTLMDHVIYSLFVRILDKLQLPPGSTSEELVKVLIQLARGGQSELLLIMGDRKHIPDGLRNLLLRIGSGHVEVIKYLLSIGARPSEVNEIITFSLRAGGRFDAVQLLLEHGANPEANEHSALTEAASMPRSHGRVDVINLLIDWYRAHPQGYGVP